MRQIVRGLGSDAASDRSVDNQRGGSSPRFHALLLPCLAFCLATLGPMPPATAQDEAPVEADRAPSRWTGEPITLSLRDADLVETLRNFAKIGNFNLVLDPSVDGKVNVELRNVPWDQALDQILKAHGLGTDIVGDQRLIASPPSLVDQRRRLQAVQRVELRLRHTDPAEVASILRRPSPGMLTDQGSAEVATNGTLVIRDRAFQLQRLGPLILGLDVKTVAAEDDDLTTRADAIWRRLRDAERGMTTVVPRKTHEPR